MSNMQNLINFSCQNPSMTPREALLQYVAVNANAPGQQNTGMVGGQSNPMVQQMAQTQSQGGLGRQTPSMDGASQFASPAMARLGLPGQQGSPMNHTPSPAMSHMPGPVKMAAQHSQQGSNAAGTPGSVANAGSNIASTPNASVNTSPNNKQKRRRSTVKVEVKTEGDEAGGEGKAAGPKVKASPRVGGKRQKGAAA